MLSIPFIWDGDAMLPPDTLLPALRRSLTAGNTYKMIVAEKQRSSEQNRKMWAMLAEVSTQATLRNQHWTSEQWKGIFMQELGYKVEVLPTLDGTSWFPCGHQSSKMSTAQMAELIELMYAEGTQRGVKFADDTADHMRSE
jgi:hypothetical protein